MRYRTLLLALLAGLTLALAACQEKPELPKDALTLATIEADLPGKLLTGLDGGEFTLAGPMYVRLDGVDYDGHRATARLLLRAIHPEVQEGVQGEVRADYEFGDGRWHLRQVKAAAAERMAPAYANRLAELVDFPLHFAANIGDLEQVEAELQADAEVDRPEGKKQSTALMFASERGFLEIARYLVGRGADVNRRNRFGFTPLHAAANGSHVEVAGFLLENGAEVDAADENGRTPLYFAAEKDSLALARLLTEQGADLNAQDRKHWTPLYAAAERGSVEVARHLIEKGAAVNLQRAEGTHSPLLTAAYDGNPEMIRLLLEAGADPAARMSTGHAPYQGLTALEIARKQGHQAAAELLQQATAR